MSKKKEKDSEASRVLKLADVDLSKKMKHKEYEALLYQLQIDLVRLQRLVVDSKMRIVCPAAGALRGACIDG